MTGERTKVPTEKGWERMKYQSTLLAVTNMERSKAFYCGLLGREVVADFGANVTLSGGITLQTLDSWKGFLNTQKVTLPNNGGELYFETEDMDAFLPQLDRWQVQFVHQLKEHRWGQRVVRFYDPDGHIIEVAEGLEQVAKRFLAQGMTPEQVAQRMDVTIQTLDLN